MCRTMSVCLEKRGVGVKQATLTMASVVTVWLRSQGISGHYMAKVIGHQWSLCGQGHRASVVTVWPRSQGISGHCVAKATAHQWSLYG